jgi:HD-GYP domain-containing protein (c-di-GMP phosphodiesterase class II)
VLKLGFGKQIARLVSDHHERLDGSGYPRGLRGTQLDLETRVLMVCDVFDALLSERVYREAWTLDRALGLLRTESGTALDRRCVDALERIKVREGQSTARTAA